MHSRSTPAKAGCPACESTQTTEIIDIDAMPVHCNIQWPTQSQALQAPTGDIRLGFCQTCGHVYNTVFDPAAMAYTQAYENSLHFSPRFNEYAQALADHLIARYGLIGKNIAEIGCGKGDFLLLLCDKGENRGYGFDPSYEGKPADSNIGKQVAFRADFFSAPDLDADLVCCRHVLEHVEHPLDFLRRVRESINNVDKTRIYFEVPNVLYSLQRDGIWDFIYEHRSYFSPSSLAAAFISAGFDVLDLHDGFDGQYLCVEAKAIDSARKSLPPRAHACDELKADVAGFQRKYRDKLRHWQAQLNSLGRDSRRGVVWGGGSKGVTFLNVFKSQQVIEYVVDLNARKQGLHVAGTGQKITPPQYLMEYRPDCVIVMNQVYETEIRQILADMNLDAQVLCA